MQGFLRTACRARPLTAFPPRTSRVGFGARSQILRTLVTKRYTPDHEAIVYDDTTGMGTVFITEHAQSVLGDVVFVEITPADTEVAQGEPLGAVESVKAASDIYAPVSGTIQEINEALSDQPGLLNKSAEDKGWLCKIKLSKPSEMDSLMTEEAYKASL
ncbi:putative the H protein shuttles the methylamine group of glycine from the P protein to the T protein [Lyophyllum shimeji]|uniref:Glycine cleavage system H protein n=1 Tax=Lyophyllum shimeji TaxID=47721 RepID=A0A9P3PHJ1_LYOSH|nr:putative the H protein shuttles the methylamine group of glycine from the P protein to the T protein [Lyophyllum shimeji]